MRNCPLGTLRKGQIFDQRATKMISRFAHFGQNELVNYRKKIFFLEETWVSISRMSDNITLGLRFNMQIFLLNNEEFI